MGSGRLQRGAQAAAAGSSCSQTAFLLTRLLPPSGWQGGAGCWLALAPASHFLQLRPPNTCAHAAPAPLTAAVLQGVGEGGEHPKLHQLVIPRHC